MQLQSQDNRGFNVTKHNKDNHSFHYSDGHVISNLKRKKKLHGDIIARLKLIGSDQGIQEKKRNALRSVRYIPS